MTSDLSVGAAVLDGAASSGARAAVTAPAHPMRVLGAARSRYAMLGPAPGASRPDHTLVCLEAPNGLGLPISVIIATELLNDVIDAPEALVVGDGGMRTRHWEVVVRRWIEDRVVFGPDQRFDAASVARLRAGLAQASAPPEPPVVFEQTEAFAAALIDGTAAALIDGTAAPLRRRAEALIGLGLGATPAGDDVVAAATVTLHAHQSSRRRQHEAAVHDRAADGNAHHDIGDIGFTVGLREHDSEGHTAMRLGVLQSVIDDRAAQTAPLSAALLRAAAQGRAVRALRDFIAACTGDRDPGSALSGLLAVGHSSGYFLAAGALAAAQALNANRVTRR